MEKIGHISNSYMREKQLWFGGSTQEMVLVTESGKEMGLGSYPRLGNEMWSYNRRPAEILDAAELEIISIDGLPFSEER